MYSDGFKRHLQHAVNMSETEILERLSELDPMTPTDEANALNVARSLMTRGGVVFQDIPRFDCTECKKTKVGLFAKDLNCPICGREMRQVPGKHKHILSMEAW